MKQHNLSPEQINELTEKLAEFNKDVESSIENYKEHEKETIENGEYNYLVKDGDHNPMEKFHLSEIFEEAMKDKEITVNKLIEFAIENDHFKMEYEELANPFHYGGSVEDEFQSISWGGDRDYQYDKKDEFKLSFNLKDIFKTVAEFKEFVNYEIGRSDYDEQYFELYSDQKMTHVNIRYNTDYDVIRCILKDEEKLLEFINSAKTTPFTPKILKITEEEYNELSDSHSGFCEYCGKINDGGHEPDAEKYECSHCERKHSYGVELCRIGGKIEIVDNPEDSEYEDALD